MEEVELLRLEEQFVVIATIRSVTVVLSARTRNVVGLVELDTKAAATIGPPGRLLLSGLPYYERRAKLLSVWC